MNIVIRKETFKNKAGIETTLPVTCSRKQFKQRYGKEALANTPEETHYQFMRHNTPNGFINNKPQSRYNY